ncbi:MAG: hypothetical protein KHZ15_12565 [Coprobacillus cateniformis]|uniref:hypothetical protein n=1 Tax=Longibaculum muris TaxID=1796628 RepID=UPI003AB6D797|nr:hypothetical protein [Coprobacillus cateniformis]
MFKKFFGHDDEEDEVFESVDPVLEQRRKEKFSTPLIYNDEEETEEVEKKEEKKPEPKKTVTLDTTYHMSEIISPMTGLKETKKPEVKVNKPKVKKIKKETDELIPIISPFYGPATNLEEEKVEKKSEVKKEKAVHEDEPSVENNLRNIAHIVEEEQDQLKIIEERTGEFKLDFKNKDEDSFIDEIDDSMSLDELMSLYEKKFKD